MSANYLTDLDGPAIAPPEGTTPNFDLQDRNHAIGYFVVIFCAILSTVAVVLRLASRYHLGRFYVEDIYLIMGYVSSSLSGLIVHWNSLISSRGCLPDIYTRFMSFRYGQVSTFTSGTSS